ncbi:glycosyltransferase family 2 protein [Psychrobacter frigidicola]|uniref:glycosyltransferase family 2 protein n=1 Tax=Psychrobacter frigidicola TaxID=45611 RepID=UPI00191AC82A|nr:glycosyltransferase family 2 protein [Psychrobacter frigidicola]
MTIGKDMYFRKIYAGVGLPFMSKDAVSQQAYANNDIDTNNNMDANTDIKTSFGSSNKTSHSDNAKNTDSFNNSKDVNRSVVMKSISSFNHSHKHKAPLVEKPVPVRLSFQMMTRAEPVEMVIATIKSLITIKAPDDEILIVDNNNTETALYEPLAKFCAGLDERLNVHFYHIDAVAGFKAGALNLALGLMDPRCTHLVVVDSDYQALPQARTSIATAINNHPDHALLQFPQFYRDAGRVDVHSELNHYFNYHLYRPFNRQRALSTGTYAVIRRDALLRLGGWSGASITEDAQMGVLMHCQGLRSQFIPEVIATGLLPNTLGDLMSQRRRWIYGNMQVLNSYFSIRPLPSSSLSVTNSLAGRLPYMRAHLSQLSAWINFTGIFILLHICTLLIVTGAMLMDAPVNLLSLLMPLYVVYGSYALFLARRLWAYSHDNAPLNQQVNDVSAPKFYHRLRTWALHLSFWELGALSWLPVLWGRDKPFICTPKHEYKRTRYSVWAANIAALPKLLLVLNIITAIIVAPFSPLYSPLLFACALTVCVLKLWSAKVVFANYTYTDSSVIKSSVSTGTAKSIIAINTDIKSAQSDNFTITKKPITSVFEDKKTINS